MGARLLSSVSVMMILFLAAREWNAEAFGLLAILLSLMNFMMTMDLGFRFGMGNRLAALSATPGSSESQRQTFWAVFHLECLIGLAGVVISAVALPCLDWARLFNIGSSDLAIQVRWIIPGSCLMLMLNQPLTLVSAALFARHKIATVSMMSAVQSVLLVVAFWGAAKLAGVGLTCVLFFGSYLLVGAVMTTVAVIRLGWRWSIRDWREQWCILRSLSKPSLEFFWLSVTAMATALIGPFLAGALGGLKVAGDFALIQRIFGMQAAVHLAVLVPLGPEYTQNAVRGEWDQIRVRLRTCVRLLWPLMVLGGGLLLVLIHPLLLRILSGRWVSEYVMAGLLAAGSISVGWANTHSVLLNSLGIVRKQALLSLTMFAPVVGLPLVLGVVSGVNGIAASMLLCSLPAMIMTTRWAHDAIGKRTFII